MNTGKGSSLTAVAPATYSFGENPEHAITSQAMAIVALSHTTVEHQLYSAMLAEIATVGNARRLIHDTRSYEPHRH